MNPFDPELLEAVMFARLTNPGMFQSLWEMDEQGIEEESEEEIQKDPKKKILWAAENNHLEITKSLLEDDPILVNSRDSDMYTPLHRACYNGHTEMVEYLLSHNADILARTEDGWHPIHSAARWNQAEVISILLRHGADINAGTNSGQTPLHLAAAEKDSAQTLSLLLSNCHINTAIRNSLGETAEDICLRTSEHCCLFEQRRKQQEAANSSNILVKEIETTPMNQTETLTMNEIETGLMNVNNHHETDDETEEILNLSDNVAMGMEDLCVSMDTNEIVSDDTVSGTTTDSVAMDENFIS